MGRDPRRGAPGESHRRGGGLRLRRRRGTALGHDEVEQVGAEGLARRARVGHAHVQGRTRQALSERAQLLARVGGGEHVGQADADLARTGAEVHQQRIVDTQHGLGLLEKPPAVVGQHRAARGAVQQAAAEQVLEALDAQADRGWVRAMLR